MSFFEKSEKYHKKKKYIFNGGNYILSPLNKKKINSLNYHYLSNKKRKNVIINKINIEKYRKEANTKNICLEQINSKLKINILDYLSRPGNLNKLNSYTNSNNSRFSSARSNNKYFNNLTTDDLNKIKINNNKYNLKNLYNLRKTKEINIYSNNDSYNNIINNISPKRQKYEYLNTDTNNSHKNVNLLPYCNFGKKIENIKYNDILGTPSGLFKRNNYRINFSNNKSNKSSENKNKKLDKPLLGVKLHKLLIKKKCPELLHFYYINKIQKGKQIESELDGE